MNQISIRLSTFEDTAQMRELAIHSFRHTFAEENTPENMDVFLADSYSLKKMREEFYEPGSVLYLAFMNKSERQSITPNSSDHLAFLHEGIVGFLRLRKNDEAAYKLGNNAIELHRLYIHPDCKGMGIGNKLMEVALAYAMQNRFDWIWLGVWEKNFNAQKVYAKWGFEKFSEHVFQMGDDAQTDWLLKKALGLGA
jgi:diamine N-acetyltransferase